MRLYGRRFARRAMDRAAQARVETRDAILWSVEESTKTCRVKIQGTNTQIVAHFPRNWKSIPYWLKRGNAVRILHRGGNRGFVEVIGEGRAIPTPVAGDTMPDEQILPDGIISGCGMTAMDTELGVVITSGTYRINGVVYSLAVNDQYRLFDSEEYALYDSGPYRFFLGDTGDIPIGVDVAPSVGQFRYDAFCVGADGVIDYIKGAASSEPVKPALPADHILLGDYILMVGGAAAVTEPDIGRQWTTPYASTLNIDIEGSGLSYDMPWADGASTADASIALQLRDQYCNNFSGSCTVTVNKETGGGSALDTTLTCTGSASVTWTRDQQVVDTDPVVFTVTGVVGSQNLTSVGIINPQSQAI